MSITKTFRVKPGKRVDLGRWSTDDTSGISKTRALRMLEERVERIAKLQDRMYAEARWSVLVLFQAMDAAGKDSSIEHVMSGIDPRGLHVTSFGQPSREELAHDYLWRTVKALPARGHIAVHNRSHYEEVVITRVHPEILEAQRLPASPNGRSIFTHRYRQIRNFERHLVENGTAVIKCFLHVSRREQARRLLARMEDPEKHWKVQLRDLDERRHWDRYMEAYEDAIAETSTADAPWFIIPADHKWFTWVVVATILEETLNAIGPTYPSVTTARRPEWAQAKQMLQREVKA